MVTVWTGEPEQGETMSTTRTDRAELTTQWRPMGRLVGSAVGLAIGVTLLSACAGRPAVDDLAQSVMEAGVGEGIELTESEASCIAGILDNSDLENATLAGLVENFDNPEIAAADVDRIEGVVADAAVECAGS